ncbi:MAG: hypothetical protein ACLGI3_00005, partial [Actinomycetes bacterium]
GGGLRAARRRTSRLVLGGVLTTAVATGVLATPVGSDLRGDAAPVAARAPWSAVSSSVEEPAPRRSPGGTGTGSIPAATAESPAAVAPESERPPAPPPAVSSRPPMAATVASPAACAGGGRSVMRPHAAGTVLSAQWKASAPAADVTYDLDGVVSTAFPSTEHPFNTGTGTPGVRTCVVGGELRGTVDPGRSWEWFHDQANAACVKVVAIEWLQIHGTRCDGVEDGFRPQEGEANSNRTTFGISGTYLTDVADDCLENDYTLGGVLRDNLWESCFTGISERPSSNNGTWTSPADETLVLDRMLIGLRSMPHDSDKGVGPNALFKWSTSANKVVIRCSTFFVPQVSVNGTDTMAIPAGTVVDDSACPNNPSTIVWTGGGDYPAPTAGIRVVTDRGVWDRAVANWKAAHGHA